MNPKELSNNLRRIASAIDNSSNPSKSVVLSDLQTILSAVAGYNWPMTKENLFKRLSVYLGLEKQEDRRPKKGSERPAYLGDTAFNIVKNHLGTELTSKHKDLVKLVTSYQDAIEAIYDSYENQWETGGAVSAGDSVRLDKKASIATKNLLDYFENHSKNEEGVRPSLFQNDKNT